MYPISNIIPTSNLNKKVEMCPLLRQSHILSLYFQKIPLLSLKVLVISLRTSLHLRHKEGDFFCYSIRQYDPLINMINLIN